MPRVPVVLTCDLEPAERYPAIGAPDDWAGLRETVAAITARRPRLQAVTGMPVRFNWFLRCDPQIATAYGSATWIADRHRPLLRDLAAAGDTFGVHSHAYRWNETAREWIIDHGDQAWVNHCIASSVQAFRAMFGAAPRTFRSGDRFMSNATMAFVERAGFHFDLSTEPGFASIPTMVPGDRATGALPDYRFLLRAPYRPSRLDYQRPGRWLRRRLWMIPMSTGCSQGPVIPDPADPRPMLFPLHLMMDPAVFRRVTDGLLAQMPRPYLAIVSRSGDCASAQALAHLDANLELLAAHPSTRDFAFSTPAEAVALYGKG